MRKSTRRAEEHVWHVKDLAKITTSLGGKLSKRNQILELPWEAPHIFNNLQYMQKKKKGKSGRENIKEI